MDDCNELIDSNEGSIDLGTMEDEQIYSAKTAKEKDTILVHEL